MKTLVSIALLIAITFAPELVKAKDEFMKLKPLPAVPVPKDNPQTKEKIELGKMLFFDTRLSGNNSISCASCHNPAFGFSDKLPRGIGDGDKELGRNSPTVINSAYNLTQFWDGRAKNLEEQALGPIASPGEMNQNLGELEDEIAAIPAYRKKFIEVFGEEGVTNENIAKAIAAFERTIIAKGSKFEAYLKGDSKALSAKEKEGLEIFKGKGNCLRCHFGANFTDDGFHNIGVLPDGPLKEDLGRYAVMKLKVLKKAFKTPTLWDIEKTGPYMHNGSLATLEDVIDFYDKGGEDRDSIDPEMKRLNLSDDEKEALLSFLKTLSGESYTITIPELP